jgi:aminoglycoside phosphotransferase (APT) family kinase protein
MNGATVMVPSSLAERVEALLGHPVRTAQAAVGGHSNLVFVVGDVVVKAASSDVKRADVAREIQLLRGLDGLGCAAPTLVGASVDEEWTVLATIRSTGTPGPSRLHDLQHDESAAVVFGTLLGRLLRSVHGCAPQPVPGPLYERVGLLSDAAARLEAIELADPIRGLLNQALHHPIHARGVAFLHGDPGLHNVMLEHVTDRTGTKLRIGALLDWELAGWGNALSDLAWVHWTLWFRGLLRAAWPAFVDAYGPWAFRALGWEQEYVRACVLAQMAVLLVRTDASTAVREVWLERIGALENMPVLVAAEHLPT